MTGVLAHDRPGHTIRQTSSGSRRRIMVESLSRFIEAVHLSKQVHSAEGPLTILDDISFQIAAGTSVAVQGASGSGKTTLLGILAGLDVPSSGTVSFAGINLTTLDEDGRASLRAGGVGFVFQSFQLLQGLTAIENVMLPLELAGEGNARSMARDILTRVGLGARLSHYPTQLSGGEQQRCAIARAFATRPKLLFADEPTGNLDQETGRRVIDLLFELNREHGTTLIMATHDARLAELCERQLYLDAGRLQRDTARVN